MAVLVTAIYVFLAASKAWVAGTSPAMTPRIVQEVDLAPALHDEEE
jgi:hypothetical protein